MVMSSQEFTFKIIQTCFYCKRFFAQQRTETNISAVNFRHPAAAPPKSASHSSKTAALLANVSSMNFCNAQLFYNLIKVQILN